MHYHCEVWFPAEAGFDGLLKPKLAALGLVGGYVVTVDYHS